MLFPRTKPLLFLFPILPLLEAVENVEEEKSNSPPDWHFSSTYPYLATWDGRVAKQGDTCYYPAWAFHAQPILNAMKSYIEAKSNPEGTFQEALEAKETTAPDKYQFLFERAAAVYAARVQATKNIHEQITSKSLTTPYDITESGANTTYLVQLLCEGGEFLMCKQIEDTEAGTCKCFEHDHGDPIYKLESEDGVCRGAVGTSCNPDDPISSKPIRCNSNLRCYNYSRPACEMEFGINFHCSGYPRENQLGKQNLFCASFDYHPEGMNDLDGNEAHIDRHLSHLLSFMTLTCAINPRKNPGIITAIMAVLLAPRIFLPVQPILGSTSNYRAMENFEDYDYQWSFDFTVIEAKLYRGRVAKVGDECMYLAWAKHVQPILDAMKVYNQAKTNFPGDYEKAKRKGLTSAADPYEHLRECAEKLSAARVKAAENLRGQLITKSMETPYDIRESGKDTGDLMRLLCEGGELLKCAQKGQTEVGTCQCFDLPEGKPMYHMVQNSGQCRGALGSTCNGEDPVISVVCNDKNLCVNYSQNACNFEFGSTFHCSGYPKNWIGKQNLFCGTTQYHPEHANDIGPDSSGLLDLSVLLKPYYLLGYYGLAVISGLHKYC